MAGFNTTALWLVGEHYPMCADVPAVVLARCVMSWVALAAAPTRQPTPQPRPASAQPAEELPHVADEEIGRLVRRVVAAALER